MQITCDPEQFEKVIEQKLQATLPQDMDSFSSTPAGTMLDWATVDHGMHRQAAA